MKVRRALTEAATCNDRTEPHKELDLFGMGRVNRAP
jgi:hypothetical protein